MKLRNLLVLGAGLLVAGVAQAGITERQKPVFEPTNPVEAFTDGKTSMYMFNVGAKKFFCGANAWGTQTSVGDEGYRVYFEQYLVDGAWDGSTVYFKDSCLAKGGAMKQVFIDHANAPFGNCYVDRGSQANYWWKLQKNADNAYYRLSMAEANPNYVDWQETLFPNTFFGWCDTISGGSTVVWPFLEATTPNHVDWAFVTVADYLPYEAALKVFNVSETLKTQILAANEKGVAVPDAEAVYNNAAATIEELEAAIQVVKLAIAAYDEAQVDPSNPVDKTAELIVNPNYDGDSKDGWSGTAFGNVSYGVAEIYDKTFDSYQKIANVSNGVYAVSVQAFMRPMNSDVACDYWQKGTPTNTVIYGVSGGDSLNASVGTNFAAGMTETLGIGSEVASAGYYGPNNMEASSAYFADPERGPKFRKVLFFGVTDNSMKIGIKHPTKHGGGDWALWDAWQLTYYGSKAGAYELWLANLKENAPQFSEDAVATAGMLDEYNSFIEGLSASNQEEMVAAMAAIEEKSAALKANIAAWTDYTNLVATVSNKLGDENSLDGNCEQVGILSEYVDFDAEDIIADMSLTTEEVQAELAKLEELYHVAMTQCLPLNADVTDMFLANYDFENTSDGKSDGKAWEGSWGAFGGPSNNKCMESYDITWDAYQVVKDAPVGIYEISLQGFFRIQRDQAAYDLYLNGGQVSPGVVYVNNNTSPLKCVFEEPQPVGFYASGAWADADGINEYPNDMTSAGQAFASNMYTSTANGLVAKAGDELRIGVKGSLSGGTWAIWDNFKMVYRGKQAEYVKPYLEAAVASANANLEKRIGKEVKELVNVRRAAGETALAGTDGEAMFDALADLYALNDTVAVSEAAIAAVYEDAQGLYTAIESAVAGAEVQLEASTLAETIIMGIDQGSYNTADMAGLSEKIAIMRVKLVTPPGVATDDTPIDLTGSLQAPGFDKDGLNSIDGWQNTSGYNFGNDNTQKGALALEYYEKTFDMYQDVIGLQNGTYRVEVSAFARYHGTADDFAKYQEDPTFGETFLYAVSGDKEYSAPVALLSSAAQTEDPGITGTTTYTDKLGTVYYIPNDMVSAKEFFESGYYKSSLYANVTDGKIRIGIKKAVKETYDWVIMDDFKLIYLGTESKHAADAEAAGINGVQAAAKVTGVEIFNANGAQMNGLQKGFNIIKRTLEDGSVVVSKQFVK